MDPRRTFRFPTPRPAVLAALACSALLGPAETQAGDGPFSDRTRFGAPVELSAKVEGRCGEPRGIHLYSFPDRPAAGGALRFVAVSETPRDASLQVEDPRGRRLPLREQKRGGPPYSWILEVPFAESGTYRARLAVAGDSAACLFAEVAEEGPPPGPRRSRWLWPVEKVWDRDTENLYSTWVEKLFDDPLDESPSWKSMHEVTRQPERNFLHDSLGMGEDSEGGLVLEPDCADLPYFLRGYFAWKLRLPFQYSRCYSSGPGQPPICREFNSNLQPAPAGKESLAGLQKFFSRSIADAAHSATGRTAAADDNTDVYPIRITADTLRPGTVYIDPYGHVLVVAKRIPQVKGRSGILLAVDAQPDGTVARKRYWRGNFLFALGEDGSAAGFKRFRPVVPDGDSVRALANSEILAHPAYGDWSMQQYESGVDGFYDRVDVALSPQRRSVRQVLLEVVDSLEQQVNQRVASVQGGEDYMNRSSGVMAMPDGAAIFQTVGPWEDYATPSRDMRILIAIDVARGFPDTVVRNAGRFYLPNDRTLQTVRSDLTGMLEKELAERTFVYIRSDGSPWSLTLADFIDRAEAIEMAYNPNDCMEIRWGAPEDSIEAMTCHRHAPAAQRRKMKGLRDWFRTRSRPST